MARLSEAQKRALVSIAPVPMGRGIFLSGWGPCGFRARRVTVSEATANKLISLGLIERWDVEGDSRAATIRITEAGRLALQSQDRGTW